MKDSTIWCSKCQADHGLFWSVDATGGRTLSYRCGKVEGTHEHEMRYKLAVRKVRDHMRPKKVNPDIPVEWASELRKKKQAESQLSLL